MYSKIRSKLNVSCQVSSVQENGFIFLEIVISVAIISIALVTFLGMAALAINTSTTVKQVSKIDAYTKEEMEAVRSFRDGSTWATTGLGTAITGIDYFMMFGGNPTAWALQAGTETIDVFTRKVVFDQVSRDPVSGDIETTYNVGNDEPNNRKATVTITWGSKTYQTVTYFTNWQ